ncbi:MAG TPA: hypothetical protein VNC22_01310, partial [Sporichthya sp.]|nr:hypothetical protein [Sporichthya sp.]
MGVAGFYNTNVNRSYPFVAGTVGGEDGPLTLLNLPDACVADCGFVAGCKSRFAAGEHAVYLNRLYRSGGTFYFEFASDAPGLFGATLTFSRDVSDPDYAVEYADSGSGGLSDSSESASRAGACDEPLWYGFLV